MAKDKRDAMPLTTFKVPTTTNEGFQMITVTRNTKGKI